MELSQLAPMTSPPHLPPDKAAPVEARLQLAAIIDSSDDAIISKNLQGVITSWNASATRLFGYTADEIVGQSVLLLIPDELRSEEHEILRRLRAGQRIEHFETRRRRKNGEIVHISLTISPIKDASGTIVGISKIARDISDRKRTEEALIQSERLAAIGRMAASIAHEVNNPLEAILNLAYLLSGNPSLDEEAREYTRLLLQEILRVSEITKRTLSFYRDTSHAEPVHLADVFQGVLQLHSSIIDQKEVRISTEIRDQACVLGRPGELRQVFTNLVLNSLDALPPGGELKLRAHPSQHGNSVDVIIADNGSGIPAPIRTRIFEPFFSTKQSRGTGLGLWVCESIIRKYGGRIRMRTSCAPTRRTGTIFRITLPTHA